MTTTAWTYDGTSWKAPGRAPIPAPRATDSFVLGTTEPTDENTGCRIPRAQLTVDPTFQLTTTTDGQVIEGAHFTQGSIHVRHRNVTVRDCVVQIGPYASKPVQHGRNFAIYADRGVDTSGLRVEYVTIDPANCGITGAEDDYGAFGLSVTTGLVWRCNVWRVGDCVSHDGTGPLHVLGNRFKTRWWPEDPLNNAGAEGLHCDGVQIAGGSGHRIIGNSISAHGQDGVTPMSGHGMGVIVTPYRSLVDDVTIARNWFRDGETGVSLWPRYNEGGPAVTNATVYGNRHGGSCSQAVLITESGAAVARRLDDGVVLPEGLADTYGTWTSGQVAKTNVWRNNQGTGVPA